MSKPFQIIRQDQAEVTQPQSLENGVIVISQEKSTLTLDRIIENGIHSNKIIDTHLQDDSLNQQQSFAPIIEQDTKSDGEIDNPSQQIFSFQPPFNLYQPKPQSYFSQDSIQHPNQETKQGADGHFISLVPQQAWPSNQVTNSYENNSLNHKFFNVPFSKFDIVDLQKASNRLKQKKESLKSTHFQQKNLFLKKLNKSSSQSIQTGKTGQDKPKRVRTKDGIAIYKYFDSLKVIKTIECRKRDKKKERKEGREKIEKNKDKTQNKTKDKEKTKDQTKDQTKDDAKENTKDETKDNTKEVSIKPLLVCQEKRAKKLEPIFIELPPCERKCSIQPIYIHKHNENRDRRPIEEESFTDSVQECNQAPKESEVQCNNAPQELQVPVKDKEAQKQSILQLIKENQKGFLQLLRSGKLFKSLD